MVVHRYFYVDIDPIAGQVGASRLMEFTAIFPQQFTAITWKASFTFLPFDMWFLFAPIAQLVDQPCTILSSIVGSEIHYHRPQPIGFSHIG
jgi:hypothetical protein